MGELAGHHRDQAAGRTEKRAAADSAPSVGLSRTLCTARDSGAPESRWAVEPLLMRATEVAIALNLGRSTVYEMMASGALPTIRIGRAIRVPRSALEQWVARQTRHSDEVQS